MKRLIKFLNNNPVFAVSITLGLIILIVKKWSVIIDTTKSLVNPMLDTFQNPINIKTWVTSSFGTRKDPKGGKTQFHNGIDLHAPSGTPVLAPADGIAHTSISPEGGNQLVITHDNGYKTGYAHLSTRAVSEGQKVKKGQLVAYSGNSGIHTTAPHLHFTLTNKEGRKIDPLTMFNIPLKA